VNDVKLQEGHPVDENLRPLKVGGKVTALEIAQNGNGARVIGNLEVTGDITGNVKDVELDLTKIVSTDLTIDDSGDITLDADGGEIYLKDGGNLIGQFSTSGTRPTLTLYEDASGGTDQIKIECRNNGQTYIQTTDGAGTDADLNISADGDYSLNSATGVFITKNNGTEFSPANSSYAGMILGYTALGIDSADASYTTTTSWAVVDSTAKVSFVAPPSGNVEIFVSVYVDTDIGRILEFGLSDNATYSPIDFPNSNDVTNEHSVYRGDETDEEMVSHQWVVTGLTPGTSYEWWFAATSVPNAGAYTLKWGGDVSAEYQPFTMKATALPATIYTG